MTTLRACRKALKSKCLTGGLLIAHVPGHEDRRGIDRGYIVISMQDAIDFEQRHVVEFFEPNGRRFGTNFGATMAEFVAARIRLGMPVA